MKALVSCRSSRPNDNPSVSNAPQGQSYTYLGSAITALKLFVGYPQRDSPSFAPNVGVEDPHLPISYIMLRYTSRRSNLFVKKI
jgi:hypothetical protein